MKFLIYISLCFFLFINATFFAASLSKIFTEKDESLSAVFIFGTATFINLAFIHTMRKKRKATKAAQLDTVLLGIAIKNNGLITATDLALGSQLTIEEANTYLEDSHTKGLCGRRYAEDSYIAVYEFERELTKDEKLNSKYVKI